jgi:hypothetical protein
MMVELFITILKEIKSWYAAYKKKWKVDIAYSKIGKSNKDDWEECAVKITNNTNYYLEVKSLKTKAGNLEIASYTSKIEYLSNLVCINARAKDYNTPRNLEKEKLTLAPSKSLDYDVRYKGEKTKLIVEYRIKDCKPSRFFNDYRKSERYLPF